MYLLDTDSLSNALSAHRSHQRLRENISREAMENLNVPIVVVQEVLKGLLAPINNDKSLIPIVQRYAVLEKFLRDMQSFNVLPYDERAEAAFQAIPSPLRQRIGTRDSRIAAIALSRGLILVTSNTSHFGKVDGLRLEDWTLARDAMHEGGRQQ